MFFFKHLYWSIIALQWCVSFCFITKWISYTYQRYIVMRTPWGGTRALLYHCTIVSLPFFLCLHSFVPLRSLISETCSRASIAARLRSQNGLGQNGFSCQESHSWFSFSGDPRTYLLTLMMLQFHDEEDPRVIQSSTPWGSWAQKPFCVPRFFDYRK